MGKHWQEDTLDGYGHLNWTVGNEDWIACFDAILSPCKTKVFYHVVVDCESGGFCDTIESGEHPISKASDALSALPDYWASICFEHYADEPDMFPIEDEILECAKRWKQHVSDLVSQGVETLSDTDDLPSCPCTDCRDEDRGGEGWSDRELRAMRP